MKKMFLSLFMISALTISLSVSAQDKKKEASETKKECPQAKKEGESCCATDKKEDKKKSECSPAKKDDKKKDSCCATETTKTKSSGKKSK